MSKIKCFAPWIHSYIGPNDQRALCCQAKPFTNSQNQSFSDFWNSKQMKLARVELMQGKFPSSLCSHCEYAEISDDCYYKKFQLDDGGDKILKATREDGHYDGKPYYLDYRVSNLCNLSCRTCNSEFSSRIEKKERELGISHRASVIDREGELEELVLKGNEERKLYFASGEVLVQPRHLSFLRECCERAIAHKIELIYNTNLSYPQKNIENILVYFKQFKSVDFMVSFDPYGKEGEFLRDGLKWNQFVHNLNYIINEPIFKTVGFYYVLTLPGLLHLKETLGFLNQMKRPLSVCMIIPKGYAKLLSPYVLEPKVLRKVLEDGIKECELQDSEYIKPLKELLLETLNRPDEQLPTEELLPLFSYAENLDQVFKRKGLLDYYTSNEVTKGLADKVRDQLVVTKSGAFYVKDDYWIKRIKELSINKDIDQISFFPKSNEVLRTGRSIVVLSKKSWLASKLNKKDYDGYVMESELHVEGRTLLGSFSFLLRNRPAVKIIGSLLDALTFHFREIFALHEVYIVNKPK